MSNENQPTPAVGAAYDDDIALPTNTVAVETVVEAPVEQPVVSSEPVGTDVHSDDVEEAVEGLAVFLRHGPNPNAELSHDPSTSLDPRRQWRDGEYISLMPCTSEEFNRLAQSVKRIDPTTSAEGRRWQNTLGMARETLVRADVGLDALMREESFWRQSVRTGDVGSAEMRAARPPLAERRDDKPLVGEEAMLYMQAMLGQGSVMRVPLWHSGLWVSLKAPTELQLLELDRRLANDKIYLGRATNGLAYSNTAVFHNSYLFNFALSLVFDCSIAGFSVDQLKQKILITDLPTLLWGLLCTIYPNGYQYHRPCVVDPSVCTHVVEELLDISKLSWTDHRALTEVQRKHMVRKSTKFTDIELQRYASEHSYNKHATVLLRDIDGVLTTMELRVPTLADYEQTGFAWVDGIVSQTDATFGSQLDGDERNSYIMDQAQATSLRQYAHWVERLNLMNGQSTISDRTTLEAAVGQLTGDPLTATAFMDGMRKFINTCTISQIAIPSYKCPKCQKDQNTAEESKHPHLIPLDIGLIFFILLGQRTTLLLATGTL